MPEYTTTPTNKKSASQRTSPRRQGVRLTKAQRETAQEKFLKSFASNGNVRVACMAAGVDRSTVYQWSEHDPEFGVLYNQAKEDVNDAIRAEIYRRAMYGEDEIVVSMGKVVYVEGETAKDKKPLTKKVKSDVLLMFHAKARMPEYRDKKVEVIDKDSGSVQVHVFLPD